MRESLSTGARRRDAPHPYSRSLPHPRWQLYGARMPRPPAPLPASLDAAGFRVAAAHELGVGRGRLRSSDIRAPFHGARVVGTATTQIELARAFAPLLSGSHAFGGITAAAVLGLPLAKDLQESTRLDVIGPRSSNRVRREGIRMRRVRDASFSTTEFDGLRLVAPVLMLEQLAREISEHALVGVVEALLSKADNYPGLRFLARPGLELATLAESVRGLEGMRGAVPLNAAMLRARTGVESPMESSLRLRLIDAGLPEPQINPSIKLPSGRVVRPDLAYRAARLLIDYEGDHHRTDAETWFDDIERVRDVVDAGHMHLRVTRGDLAREKFERLVAIIQRRLAAAASSS